MRLTCILLALLLIPTLFSYRQDKKPSNAFTINEWYSQHLEQLKHELVLFNQLLEQQPSKASLQQQFKNIRLAYKKIAVLTDYFNPYESAFINGPALARVEEDHPEKIIPPQGLQLLEELIWNQVGMLENPAQLKDASNKLIDIISTLEEEPDRIFKFKDHSVWYALRLQVIGIISKGVTGFDSPVALHSLPEAISGLTAMQELASVFYSTENDAVFLAVDKSINAAKAFLQAHNNFNGFDRMAFIKKYMNPLSEAMLQVVQAKGYGMPVERRPLNMLAKNIFSEDAFDVDFFSPNSRYEATDARVLLGKALFYETKLSANNVRSCASCHKPEMAFTDGLKTASSLDEQHELKRNTPTLLNAVFQTKQFYDSRKTLLEFQIASVVHNKEEMGGSIEETAKELNNDSQYQLLFKQAYPNDADAVSVATIANALASYIRSLQSLHSRFDAYVRNEAVTLTSHEINGFNLFAGKARCATCHFIPLFNGLVPPLFNESESEVLGVPQKAGKPAVLDPDSGKYYFTSSPVHHFSFKTPTVRNIAVTAPYMHNGVFNSLEEVMGFYNDGGGKGLGIAPPNQTLPFDKLELSKREKKDIILFMKTLTDTTSYKNWHH